MKSSNRVLILQCFRQRAIAFGRDFKNFMTPGRVCAAIAFVSLFILIIVCTRVNWTVDTATSKTTKATITTDNKPAVYFVATRDSNDTNKANNDITFTNIPVSVGDGMSPNGWFTAPVAGVYV